MQNLFRLSKAFAKPASSALNNFTYKAKKDLWIFRKKAAENFDNVKFDEALVDKIKNPQWELVKPGKEKLVGWWLLATAGAVFATISLGGYTRLSRAGLSMVRWKPIGYRYPQNLEQWNEEFENYKKFPEYEINNKGCSLEYFKFIFLLEYAHRTLGNVIGGLFGIPFAYFTARGYLKPKLRNRCLGLFAFGGLQGLIGWWMVRSGLKKKEDYQPRQSVSPYRLFVHLNCAILIYGALFWNGLNLLRKPAEHAFNAAAEKGMLTARGKMIMILHFVAFNIMSGVTVAGIEAGRVYNTWPDMNGHIVPPEYFSKSPLWKNFFENMGTVQFNHRMFAYLTYASATYLFYLSRTMPMTPAAKASIAMFYGVVNLQLVSGVTTLMRQVPVPEAVFHQANAVFVLSTALYTMHTVRKPNAKYLHYIKQAGTTVPPINPASQASTINIAKNVAENIKNTNL